jgi:hypothetical protein
MKSAEIPLAPAPGSVTTMVIAASAKVDAEMKCLRPLTMKSSPSRTAAVVMLAASEPDYGSVIAKQMPFSPRTTGST